MAPYRDSGQALWQLMGQYVEDFRGPITQQMLCCDSRIKSLQSHYLILLLMHIILRLNHDLLLDLL
ncbi:MAG: hypothetical protein ACC669_07295, partial [bacterium]